MTRSDFTYNPRPYLPSSTTPAPTSRPANPTPSTPFRPAAAITAADSRFSTASASAPFSAIGNLLSSPYDTDDSDLEPDALRTPDTPVGPAAAVAGVKVRGDRRKTQTRNIVSTGHVQSVAGELEVEVIEFGPGSKLGLGPGSTRPRMPTSPRSRSGIRYISSNTTTTNTAAANEQGKRVTIIDFPTPSISPSSSDTAPWPRTPEGQKRTFPSPASPAYPSPSRPGLLSPFHTPSHHPDARPTLHLQTNDLTSPRRMPHLLPPPVSPISPLLAAPPLAHNGARHNPRFFGSAGNVNSGRSSTTSTNESIAGYDRLCEKKALSRGGEEELLAFSPRTGERPGKRGQGKMNGAGVSGGSSGRMSTVDFWKRFSAMGALAAGHGQGTGTGDVKGQGRGQARGQGRGASLGTGKESDWLAKQHSGRRSIRKWSLVGLVLLLLVVAAIVTYAVYTAQSATKKPVVSGKDV